MMQTLPFAIMKVRDGSHVNTGSRGVVKFTPELRELRGRMSQSYISRSAGVQYSKAGGL